MKQMRITAETGCALKLNRLVFRFALLVGLASLGIENSGCISIQGKAGETHHIILGFGIVTVGPTIKNAVVATHVNALGVSISDRPGMKLGLGYTDSTVVSVDSGAEDVRVEVSRLPGGPLIVDCPSAILNSRQGERLKQ